MFKEVQEIKEEVDKTENSETFEFPEINLFEVNDNGGEIKIIDTIRINKGGIILEHSKKEDWRSSSYNSEIEKLIKLLFKNKIEEMINIVIKPYAILNNRLDKNINELKEKGAKYLIASTL